MPRRHLPGFDAALDRPGPRPGILEGRQRHRRHGSRAMTRLTFVLEDRRDILRECRGFAGASAAPAVCRQHQRRAQHQATDHEIPRESMLGWHHVVFPHGSILTVERSLSRRYWSSSTEIRRRLRPTRHWPGHAECILPACRTSRVGAIMLALLEHRDARLVEGHFPGSAKQVQRDRRDRRGEPGPQSRALDVAGRLRILDPDVDRNRLLDRA